MGSSKKNFKATKKFEKNHLKGVLDQRKSTAKIKQRAQIQAKKQSKRTRDAEFYKTGKGEGEGKGPAEASGKKKQPDVNSMSVDEFFQEGFEILEKKSKGDKKKAAGKLGKRKREEAEEGEGDVFEEDGASVGRSDDEGSDEEAVGMSKKTMEDLAEKDPEFYKFLQENDPEALDFDENADLAEVDDLSGSEDEEPDEPKKKKQKKDKKAKKAADEDGGDDPSGKELTKEMVARWKQLTTDVHSLKAARQIVLAFRSAAHLNEDEDESKMRYSISSPEVFHEIIFVGLQQIPEVLQHHIPVKETAAGKVHVPTNSKKFKTLSILLRSYVSSILHLLSTLSDDGTIRLTLSALNPLVPYLLSFRKLLKNVIKTVVNLWSQPASSESTRITAFLVMRQMVVVGDKGVRETVLKTTYQGLVQGTRVNNSNTAKGINLMKNSAAELWGLDEGVGYTTAFTSIRQLAIHLRNSIVNNKNESYKTVYNWQYVHSLDFWSVVLSEHCSTQKLAESGAGRGKGKNESELGLLIYPLVQVTFGAMKLVPKSTYFPLQFHLVRSLLRLSRATGTYIPLATPLLDVLQSGEMRGAAKKGGKPAAGGGAAATLVPLDFTLNYKAPQQYSRTRVYQDGVADQVVELLGEYLVLWSTNIAFPEFALPLVVSLKRWMKQMRKGGNKANNNGKVLGQLAVLLQRVEANGKFIEERRAKVEFAPRDRAQVDAFLSDYEWQKTPLGVYVAAQRQVRAEKARLTEEERRVEKEDKGRDGEGREKEKGAGKKGPKGKAPVGKVGEEKEYWEESEEDEEEEEEEDEDEDDEDDEDDEEAENDEEDDE